MYFPFSELRKWSKKTAETRRRNCVVLLLYNTAETRLTQSLYRRII